MGTTFLGRIAFYPIRLKMIPHLNTAPKFEEELKVFEVKVNEDEQIAGKSKVEEYKSPKTVD
jgi:hypothetical protein